ncbi:hypothetical protein HBN50_14900 [Halobacteriovorax sp. GB3]|uniref:hypothetical protein n=1 Tax=Halobacteriovorax sp. GB3 TaxID=2719615 RepID=UPI002361447C|nr:hypothetical protein [Halobacteriovorax sp. GB3]MDD0854398.1 hypothetical protein [Halobacteriovorax sp. GB3]
MKLFNVLVFLLFSSHVYAAIPVTIYSTINQDSEFQKLEQGIDFFFDKLNQSCRSNYQYEIKLKESLNVDVSPFKLLQSQTEIETKEGRDSFIFFQESLYHHLKENKIFKKNKGITIHSVADVTGHCGFAFPIIQFEQMQSPLLKEVLQNHLLISQDRAGCGNLSRLIAHELAHLFIQDNPPHQCGDQRCGEENILSVYRYIKPRPSQFGSRGSRGGDIFDDFLNPRQAPSIGVEFNEKQCESVARTVDQLME